MRLIRHLLFLFVLVAAAACTGEDADTITLISHDSFADGVNEETFAAFTAETGVSVEVIAAGDAGGLVNQAILTKDNPLADVLFGVDDTFLSRAIEGGIFQPHESAHLETVVPGLSREDGLVTPIDYGDVCFNYDKEWFETNDVDVPASWDDFFLDGIPVTVEHPATSSPGLAFMLATIDFFGEDRWLDWWQEMKQGGVNVVPDWDTAYYGDFTRYGGTSPVVMSYASSPPAEVIFAEEPIDEAPTGVIEVGCYRQVEYAGVLTGTEYPETAGRLIDYMLSVDFQEEIPLTWFVFPANQDAELPQEFVDHTVIPDSPTRLDADLIAENRERWIDRWVAVMEG